MSAEVEHIIIPVEEEYAGEYKERHSQEISQHEMIRQLRHTVGKLEKYGEEFNDKAHRLLRATIFERYVLLKDRGFPADDLNEIVHNKVHELPSSPQAA